MKIKRIHIMGFGKLSDYELEFEDGFQVIGAENEFGKSTIMVFIRMMFYGRTGGGHDVLRNERLKYRPWDGSNMGGMIEFEYEEDLFRLEKVFGKSVSTDRVFLINVNTGKHVPLPKGEEVGMYFFGMDLDAFTRSVFIENSIVEYKTNDKDYLAEKLGRLIDYGDENDKGQEAMARLRNAMEELISKSGRSGKIVKRDEELKKAESEYESAVMHNENADMYIKECDIIEKAIELNSISTEIDKIDVMLDEAGGADGGYTRPYGYLFLPSVAVIIISVILSLFNIYACVFGAVLGIVGIIVGLSKRKENEVSPLVQKLLDEKSELMSQEKLIKVSDKYKNMSIKELKQMQREYQAKSGHFDTDSIKCRVDELTDSIKRMEEYYSSLKMAYEIMEDIQTERRKSFGPKINRKASEIFNVMTGGNYETVMVENDYNAKVVEYRGIKSIDWKYLSSGTMDQLYLAMRLAISELMAEKEYFPILMDDVLERYDDERLEETVNYLKNCGSNTQIILFTCHGNVMRLSKEPCNTGS